MRKYLLIAFLGIWTAIFPFLPIQCGSTHTAVLVGTGVIITALAFWSLRESAAS